MSSKKGDSDEVNNAADDKPHQIMEIADLPWRRSALHYVLSILVGAVVFGYLFSQTRPSMPNAVEAFETMLSAPTRYRRGYLGIFKDGGKPSSFISYLKEEIEQRQQPPVRLPRGVTLQFDEVNPDIGKQIVVSAEDEDDLLVIEAYEDPAAKPTLVKEIDFAELFRDRRENFGSDSPN